MNRRLDSENNNRSPPTSSGDRSLRQGSFIIGSYSLVVYCVAFAVELWWIVESLLILPAPAYTLCALYLFNFVIAAVLLFGLLIRQRKYLMSWTLMTVLSFFPEAGMVLFMSLYYWPTHKFEYGVIELVYWALRAIFNIFGALCVCSLYLTWRDEEMILGRLHDLTLANVESGCNGLGITRHSNGTLKQSGSLAYQNYAYADSTPVLSDPSIKSSTLHRGRFGGGSNGNFSIQSKGSYAMKPSEFSPAMMFDPMYKKSRISELGIAGIGLEPPGIPGGLPGSGLQRSRSLWNVSNDDYWNRPPPSRPVSMGYVNHILHSDRKESNTMSLDRRKNWMMHMGRRATSMDGLNTFYRYYGHNIVSNHHAPHWSKSSLGQESDDVHNYRDIAL
ncbi:unnamed protein product [Allacma fusca]|uniref:Uncharacterized protein n=1 Tax=Allacma fusca TaxID=39272 RepID=A0A8J2PVH9_9HEXA|nr:unnamed protein product [Allacma fusca]